MSKVTVVLCIACQERVTVTFLRILDVLRKDLRQVNDLRDVLLVGILQRVDVVLLVTGLESPSCLLWEDLCDYGADQSEMLG